MVWQWKEFQNMIERVKKLEDAVNWLVHHELYGGNANEAPACVKEMCGMYANNDSACDKAGDRP